MAAAWLVVAAVVGVLVGRMIRERDRQVPPVADAPARDRAEDAPGPDRAEDAARQADAEHSRRRKQ